jgi:uncharacterized protein (DUF433 family)
MDDIAYRRANFFAECFRVGDALSGPRNMMDKPLRYLAHRTQDQDPTGGSFRPPKRESRHGTVDGLLEVLSGALCPSFLVYCWYMDTLLSRITIDPAVCHGKPCVRGLRYPVETLLELLSSGMTIDEILADYEDLERDDLLAVLAFAAQLARTRRLQPVAP